MGADAFTVKSDDDVLWFFVDGATNSGDELELVAPTRVRPGEEFDVQVYAYDFAGARRLIQGVTVAGGGATGTSDASGVARLTLDRAGSRTLRATLDPNIPSAPTKVCVNADLSKCGAGRGTRIWGSRRGEHIVDTAGRDSVLAGAGPDLVLVRGGKRGQGALRRGPGHRDWGRRDRVGRDCERVLVRGRQ